MKFGKTYVTHQIPEWSIYYMNYKQLKKIIKSIDSAANTNVDESKYPEVISDTLGSFFYDLDRDIEKVDSFYNTKFKEYNRRLNKIFQVLGYQDGQITHNIESSEELDRNHQHFNRTKESIPKLEMVC